MGILKKWEKKILKKSHEINKTFNYSKGDVSLSFVLRTDLKVVMLDFKELLEKALADIDEELKQAK